MIVTRHLSSRALSAGQCHSMVPISTNSLVFHSVFVHYLLTAVFVTQNGNTFGGGAILAIKILLNRLNLRCFYAHLTSISPHVTIWIAIFAVSTGM